MTHSNAVGRSLWHIITDLFLYFPKKQEILLPVFGLLLTSVLQIFSVFGFPFLNRMVFDTVLTTLDGTLLFQVTLAICLLVLFGTIFKVLMDFQIAHLRTKLVDVIRRKSIQDILNLEYLDVMSMERGDVVQKMITASDSIAEGLAVICRNSAYLLQLFVIAAVIVLVDGSLFWIFLAVLALYLIMALPLRRLEYRMGLQTGVTMGRIHSILYEIFPAIKIIKCENQYAFQAERLDRMLGELPGLGMKQSLLAAYAKLGYLLPTRISHIVILVFGFWRMRSGDYTIGTFTMIFWFIDIVLEPTAKLRESVRTMLGSAASATRLNGLVSGPKEPQGPLIFPGMTESIELDGVFFTHKSGATVLKDVSIKVPMGGKISIVGRSGAGKSTMVNLLSGLTRPTKGKVLIDGKDMALFTRASLRNHLALVSQDVFLFDDTVRRNIDLSGLLPDTRIMQACRIAELEGLMEKLPAGLSTRVGERGVTLSGGERQRISLARAIARGATLLIFDEATSALDPEMEARILKNLSVLERERGSMTLIAVAHRPIFATGMEFAYVLEAGRMVESGPVAELVEAKRHYHKLFNVTG